MTTESRKMFHMCIQKIELCVALQTEGGIFLLAWRAWRAVVWKDHILIRDWVDWPTPNHDKNLASQHEERPCLQTWSEHLICSCYNRCRTNLAQNRMLRPSKMLLPAVCKGYFQGLGQWYRTIALRGPQISPPLLDSTQSNSAQLKSMQHNSTSLFDPN